MERLRTQHRREQSRRQQQKVVTLLVQCHQEEKAIRDIAYPDHLTTGQFAKEALLGGARCALPVRLRTGRLLVIECKVSNRELNSVKRLIREAGGKAQRWRQEFGEIVVPAVVLAGVYRLRHLIEAQDTYRLTIFWEHDLAPLRRVL